MVNSGDVVYELWGRTLRNDPLTGRQTLSDPTSYGLHTTSDAACGHGNQLVLNETISHYTVDKRRIH